MSEQQSNRRILVPVVLLVAVVAAWLYVVTRDTPAMTPQSPVAVFMSPADYQATVKPIVDQHRTRCEQAADDVLARIHSDFERYAEGITPFANDVTSWWTTIRNVRDMPLDWWQGEEGRRVETRIREKFEQHIFSEEQLESDLKTIFEEFRDAIGRHHTEMLGSIKGALKEQSLSTIQLPGLECYRKQVHDRINELARVHGEKTAYHGLVRLLVAESVTLATIQGISILFRNAALRIAVTGGFMATAATIGGSGGSLAGPAGTAVGVVVGVGVGFVVDWFMTERTKSRLSDDLTQLLESIRDGLIDGVVIDEETTLGDLTHVDHGLKRTLNEFCEDLSYVEITLIRDTLVGGGP